MCLYQRGVNVEVIFIQQREETHNLIACPKKYLTSISMLAKFAGQEFVSSAKKLMVKLKNKNNKK